jgi:hypothetical protein
MPAGTTTMIFHRHHGHDLGGGAPRPGPLWLLMLP